VKLVKVAIKGTRLLIEKVIESRSLELKIEGLRLRLKFLTSLKTQVSTSTDLVSFPRYNFLPPGVSFGPFFFLTESII
jgi:hypothetical protein